MARRAPSVSDSNLAHTTDEWISGLYVAWEEKPQSALATTFSRPTSSANLDELIRALGTGRVEELIEAEGESRPFQTFTRQPAHRGEGRDQQLHRFMGTRSGRKIRYGHVLAAALDLTLIPGPLAGLLSAV